MIHLNTPAEDIKEITTGIAAITELLEENMAREGCEGEEIFIAPHQAGGLLYASKHLAQQATLLAESIVDREEDGL